ncbi:hypothetical protein CRG98_012115 [Punica granatum]|uniref:Uncharacterized protein n=1 Tax=Punica granatum TaxID=22663 RepID=A0A2I0KGA7_PUNGR|nr:hypothetical protein CRG98_012115 [Punica granatum]
MCNSTRIAAWAVLLASEAASGGTCGVRAARARETSAGSLRSALAGMSCRPPSCLITQLEKTSVLPKWLMREVHRSWDIQWPWGHRDSTERPTRTVLVVKRPYGLGHKSFNITTTSYCLENDLGECSVYEIRGMRKNEPVAGVALIGISGSVECTDDGELTLYRGELVRYHDVLSRHWSLNEGRVFLDCRGQLNPLKVEHSTLGPLELDGGPEKSPVDRGLNKQ